MKTSDAVDAIAGLLAERLAGEISPEMVAEVIASRRPLTAQEAATFLKISVDTLAKLDIPNIQISPSRKRYLIADLERWLEGKRNI